MKVVAYVRVSTGKQVEEGLGLADQEQACRAWARQHGPGHPGGRTVLHLAQGHLVTPPASPTLDSIATKHRA